MLTNRINRHLSLHTTSNASAPSPATAQPIVPHGFAPVPVEMLRAASQGDIYRIAFEAAQRSARQKLLNLLRARGEWN